MLGDTNPAIPIKQSGIFSLSLASPTRLIFPTADLFRPITSSTSNHGGARNSIFIQSYFPSFPFLSVSVVFVLVEACFDQVSVSMEDEYAKLIRRLNPPRVVIDNNACGDATVIQVDSMNKHGILLKVVQVLMDMNLIITKGYISSDAGWFMDVFNVITLDGTKIRDQELLHTIQMRLERDATFVPSSRESVGVMPSEAHTSIELSGNDRPGLLSEVCAVLADLHCNVVNADIWTHNSRAAAVVHVTDEYTGCAIKDLDRLLSIKELLCNVLRGNNELKEAMTILSPPGFVSTDRRLHQIMLADRDYEGVRKREVGQVTPLIIVSYCIEKDYSVITMRSKDRPKLFFDVICTLTDMEYVIFHGMVKTENMEAYQEFYVRHIDGMPIRSEAERQRVIQCLEAAIQRRAYEGLKLELYTEDRVGLLSDITRIFRENGLCIKRAEICTVAGKAKDTFYVAETQGSCSIDQKTIDSLREQIGHTILQVKQSSYLSVEPPQETASGFFFGNIFKARRFQNFKLVRSYSGYTVSRYVG